MGVVEMTGCAAVLTWAAALSVIDIRRHRLPDTLTMPGAAVLLAGAAICGRGLPALSGAAALTGLYLVVHLAAPAAMGGGDVKLAVGLGALTGAAGIDSWALAAMGAALLTAMVGVVRGRGGPVPHGPSMCLASLAAAAPVLF